MGRIVALASAVLLLSACGGGSDAPSSPSSPSSETVTVHLVSVPSSDDALALERRLDAKIAQKSVGQYDRTNWYATAAGGEAQLLAYGPDADALWKAMEPVVRASRPGPGSFVIKTYGEASDPSAKQVRVDIAP